MDWFVSLWKFIVWKIPFPFNMGVCIAVLIFVLLWPFALIEVISEIVGKKDRKEGEKDE